MIFEYELNMKKNEFEDIVKKSLEKENLDLNQNICFGIAVSGGADSISLLVSLNEISKKNKNIQLKVITVNHNIRNKVETEGDASFVENFCANLNLKCKRYNLQRGLVQELAKNKSCGIEDAARRLRYECFEKFINEEKIDYLCLAHNLNDQCETILMRLFQGGNSKALSGIPVKREKILRPLLNISRSEIEKYLLEQNINWKTDKTNFDNSMFRNKIRNLVVPTLDENILTWKKGIILSAKKLKDEDSFIQNYCDEIFAKLSKIRKKSLVYEKKLFLLEHKVIQIRLIYKAIEFVGSKKRISYQFIENFLQKILKNQHFVENCADIEFFCTEDSLIFYKKCKRATESVFFVTIYDEGRFYIGDEILCVKEKKSGIELEFFKKTCETETFFKSEISVETEVGIESEQRKYSLFLENLKFPFAFRNAQVGDKILDNSKKTLETCKENQNQNYRMVDKILDDWRCGENRKKIPVIQELELDNFSGKQEILCIWGEIYGFKNWIVKKES